MEAPTVVDESKWPSADLAHQYVIPSYDLVLKRLDSVDGRIQTLITLSATMVIAAPVFLKSVFQESDFTSNWLYAAIAAFAAIDGPLYRPQRLLDVPAVVRVGSLVHVLLRRDRRPAHG